MSFTSRTSSYFSSLPIPELDSYAFVKTWPAPDWLRAGAVFSHVILVDLVTLSRWPNLSEIDAFFRRPSARSATDLVGELASYRHQLDLAQSVRGGMPLPVDLGDAARVLQEFYQSDEPVSRSFSSFSAAQQFLLALHEQQWPKLRRKHSSRTRSRTSEGSWRADVELVERSPSRDQVEAEPWALFLARDLAEPSPRFRRYLTRYGAEGTRGRKDMSTLADILQTAGRDPARVIEQIRSTYPRATEMRILKRDLLGPAGDWTPAGWPRDELTRLNLAFRSGSAVDFADLEIGDRVVAAAAHPSFVSAMGEMPLDNLTPIQVEDLVGGISQRATARASARLAVAYPDLGLLVAARKPEILERTDVWDALDRDLLVTVFQNTHQNTQDVVLNALMDAHAVEPLVSICERQPTEWWRLLFLSAKTLNDAPAITSRAAVMRVVLDRLGSAAIEAPGKAPRSPSEAVLLLLSADLSAGLWRRCSAGTWASVVRVAHTNQMLRNIPVYALDRVYAVALLTAGATASTATRTNGWLACFEYLHDRLAYDSFDGEAWRVLANALPSQGADWDRCQRLRRGAVAEIRRDKWTHDNIASIVRDAKNWGADIRSQLVKSENKKKRKSALQEFLDFLLS
jgi:hypothetical protein